MPQGPVFKGLFSLPFITHMAVTGCVAVALANPTFGQEIPAENAASQPNIGGEVLLPETQQDTQTNTGTSETVRGPDSPPPEITDETRKFATNIASNQAAINISAALAVSRVSDRSLVKTPLSRGALQSSKTRHNPLRTLAADTERALNKNGESTAKRFSCKIRIHVPVLIPRRWLGAERTCGVEYPATDIEADFFAMF